MTSIRPTRRRSALVMATALALVALAAGTVTGAGVGTDTLLSVENIRGSNFADSYDATGFGSGSTNRCRSYRSTYPRT